MKDISRIFDILNQYEERHPNQKTALAGKNNGRWLAYSPSEYKHITDNISYGFMELGIQQGDRVGIISTNRPEWNMIDMAILQIGAISVPVYPTISENDYRYIVQHSGMKAVIVEGAEVMNKIANILPDTPDLKYVYTFINREKFPYLDQLIELGASHRNPEELLRRSDAVKPEDCSTIMYTSGTTGTPKGVMLSHSNIVNQIKNLRQIPAKWSKRGFSFLPLCHAYERMIVFLYQHLGMSVYYAQNLGTIAENIKEVNPTMMGAVPRVLEKFAEKICSASKNMKPVPKAIYDWAIDLAEQYKIQDSDRTLWYNCRHWVADKLIYKKIRKNIGGNFDILISGAASLQPRLCALFSAIGMPVFEGYGATETSPVIAVSQRLKYSREVGTVGFALPGVSVRIADNGEILCKGPNVMMGYYKDEELTRTVIDEDGWFHTGDQGEWTDKGQLKITGRLKNIFKTSFGKYVNPQVIEEKFGESLFIDNMVVVGENQKFAAAIISPNFEHLKSWCKRHNIDFSTPEEAVHDLAINKRFSREIEKYNALFGETERIKKFRLVSDSWSQQNGILTPTLKVKRHIVQKIYKEQIDELFG